MKGRKPNLTVIDGGAVPGRCPSAPTWLSKEAKAEWKRTAPQVFARGLLAPETMATVEAYCIAVGQVRETEEMMQREGRTISTEHGSQAHPAFRIHTAAMREARLLAAELGLTPHRRAAASKKEPTNDRWGPGLLA